jgi:phosphatidate cytidylyltransferase
MDSSLIFHTPISYGDAAWNSPIYRQTVLIVLSALFISGMLVYYFRKKNFYFVTSWASIKSWLVLAPVLFVLLGTPQPWPLIVLTLIAISGSKIFFQILGMFHKSSFVFITYLGIIGLALAIHFDRREFYNVMPMIVLGVSCLVPLLVHRYKNMIQFISLTQLNFVFLGWSFMHLGLILRFENGIFQLMYLITLTEFCDNTSLALSKHIGKQKLLPDINPRRTVASSLVAAFLTVLLAFGMRHLLPDRSEQYWLASGLIASIGGVIGDLVMSVVRRDLGVRIMGAFVLGRGDFLQRMDRMIFVAPIFYYTMMLLKQINF